MKIVECALSCATSPTSTTTAASASMPTASPAGWSQGLGSRRCPQYQHPSPCACATRCLRDGCSPRIPAYVITCYPTFAGGKGSALGTCIQFLQCVFKQNKNHGLLMINATAKLSKLQLDHQEASFWP